MNCEDPPGFTANLIFEFYDDVDKEKYVMIRYNGKYVYLCERESKECPL